MKFIFQKALRLNVWVVFGICSLSAGICACCICEGHEWGDDFALYVQQAQCLLSGCTQSLYLQNKFLTDHSEGIISPYLYPLGLPLMLAPILKLAGMNFVLLKASCVSLFILSLPLIYLSFRKILDNTYKSYLHLFLVAFNPVFFLFADNVMSDLPFMLFFYAAIYLMLNAKEQFSFYLLAGFTMAFASIVRDAGILLFPTFILHSFFRNELWKQNPRYWLAWSPRIFVLLAFLFIAFQLNLLYTGNTGEVSKMIASQMTLSYSIQNVIFYSHSFANLFCFGNVIGIVLMAISGVGFFILLKSHPALVFLFCSFLFIHISLPFRDLRYFFPLVPIYFVFFILGFDKVFGFAKRYLTLFYLVLSILFCIFSLKNVLTVPFLCRNEALTIEMNEVYLYIQAHTSPDAIINFEKPRAVRLFTHRNGVHNDHFIEMPFDGPKYEIRELEISNSKPNHKLIFSNSKYGLYKLD